MHRVALLAAPLLFSIQSWVWSMYGEPYPAVILPGFGSVYAIRSFERATVIVNGREHSFDALLSDHPRQNRAVIAREHLHHSRQATPEVASWLLQRAKRLDPSASAVTIRWHRRDVNDGSVVWAGDFSVR